MQSQTSHFLIRAIEEENFSKIKSLIKDPGSTIDFTKKDDSGNTALMRACCHRGVLKVVLKNNEARVLGEDVINLQDNKGFTALHYAALLAGTCEITHLLTSKDIDLSLVNSEGETPLHLLARRSRVGYVSLLLDADKNAVNIGKSSLIDIFNHQKNTASMIAAVCGNRRVLVKILDAGADPCLENSNGDNILMLVIRHGHTDIAKYLFQLYKERHPVLEKLIDHKNKIGETALLLGAAKGLTSVVHTIAETKKEALQVLDMEGNSALHFAVRDGRYKMMSMLLKSSASVNVVNQHSTSLLHLAAEKGHYWMARKLLKNGIDKTILNKANEAAYTVAACKGHTRIASIIRKGVSSNWPDFDFL